MACNPRRRAKRTGENNPIGLGTWFRESALQRLPLYKKKQMHYYIFVGKFIRGIVISPKNLDEVQKKLISRNYFFKGLRLKEVYDGSTFLGYQTDTKCLINSKYVYHIEEIGEEEAKKFLNFKEE